VNGVEGLAAVIEQLDGYELAAAAWEHDVLPARVRDYGPELIDMLCLSGRVTWGRLTPMDGAGKAPLKSSPIALMPREHAGVWRIAGESGLDALSSDARAIREALRARGALFFHELVATTGILRTQVERALGELAGAGLVTADSFSGLRALLMPSDQRRASAGRRRRRTVVFGMEDAGRWALARRTRPVPSAAGQTLKQAERESVEHIAWTLLRRYGVVFWRLLEREADWLPPWRDLLRVYRTLEARGDIRGGRFVAGFSGEQYALPDAVLAGGEVQFLEPLDPGSEWQARKTLLRGPAPRTLVDSAE
jgi:ATP-dependent Lhr-like helicase